MTHISIGNPEILGFSIDTVVNLILIFQICSEVK